MLVNGKYIITNCSSGYSTPVVGANVTLPDIPIVGFAQATPQAQVAWQVHHVGLAEAKRYSLKTLDYFPHFDIHAIGKEILLVFGSPKKLYCDSWVIDPVGNTGNYTITPPGAEAAGMWTLGGDGGNQVSMQVLPDVGGAVDLSQQWMFRLVESD